VAEWIEGYRAKARRWEPLFPDSKAWNKNGRWTATSERRTLTRAYKTAGVEHIKPNELGRHFFVTHAVSDLEGDLYAVKEWLGHSDPKTTERYAKLRAVPIARVLRPKSGG
jgi:site-specific recombinase XerC